MRILMIGDLNSVHTQRLARFLGNHGYEIFGLSIFDLRKDPEPGTFSDFSRKPLIRNRSGPLKYFDFLTMRANINNVCREWSIERISVQAANPLLGYAFIFGGLELDVITSFWGSEIWGDLSLYHRTLQKKLLYGSKRITAITETMKKRILEKYPSLTSEIVLVRYIVLSKEDYHITDKDVLAFKKEFSIPDKATIVSVSYASAPRHRHDLILETVTKLERDLLDDKDVWFIVPLTYGEAAWKDKVKGLITDNPHRDHMRIIERDLSDKEVMIMRSITDIFVNIPTQDTLSASMFEAISYGSIAITGKWLPYDELFYSDVFTVNIESPQDLEVNLRNVINNVDEYKQKARENHRYLREIVDPARWFKAI